jgi:hypothetical protein
MMKSHMMKSHMMKCAPIKQLARQVALAGAVGLIALAGLSPGVARAEDSGGDGTLFGSMLKGLGIGGENNIKSADVQKKGSQVRNLDQLPVPQRPAVPSVTVATPTNPSTSGPDATAAAPPSEPGFFGKLFRSGDMPANAVIPVPTRKSLTQPPLDYESPSTTQPYGEAAPAAPAKTTPESALQADQPASRPGGL